MISKKTFCDNKFIILSFLECPRGTYKLFASPDPCKSCPPNSITKEEGSTSIRDCVCQSGFKGSPHNGEACKCMYIFIFYVRILFLTLLLRKSQLYR